MTTAPFHRGVIFHRLAAEEYRKARQWYVRQSGVELSDAFRDEVDAAVDRIAENPETGALFRKKYRWIRLHRFPYLLYYLILSDERILVLAVAHASRRPGYWLRRAKSATP